MDIDFDYASLEWKRSIHKSSIGDKGSIKYPWHHSRCGYILEDGTQCLKKSYFTKTYKIEHPIIDIDDCDLKFYCYIHIKDMKNENIRHRINMEKNILKRLESQRDLFISDLNYIEKLKEKYKKL